MAQVVWISLKLFCEYREQLAEDDVLGGVKIDLCNTYIYMLIWVVVLSYYWSIERLYQIGTTRPPWFRLQKSGNEFR